VVGNRVYAGSGVGDLYRETTRFCLDAETGKPVWRVPSDLPVWSAPVVAGKHVFFGMGNGNYLESDDRPAGAILCVVAATGERVWRCDVPEGVLDRPAVDRRRVYFGARDGHCYCVDRRDGTLRWKQHLGSPVVTAPLLAPSLDGGISSVYAIGSEGRVCCLDPDTGKVEWTYDVARETQTKPELFSSPAVVVNRDAGGERRLLYFGAGLKNLVSTAAVLYCFEDHYEEP
jgi:outer membrane protein assembly factor BamB